MSKEVDSWFNSGAEVGEGLRLLSIYAPNRHLDRLVRLAPQKWGYLLSQRLAGFSSKPPDGKPRRAFREQWPFLSEPDCPPELKVLAADKITAYWNYVDGHEELYNCTTPEKCFECAKKVVENFLQNRKIYNEFCNYRDRRVILGKHPIFKQSARLAELRSLSVVELIRRRKNLEGAIWRVQSEMNKGDKPHLMSVREARLREKRAQLSEVNRLIESYEREYNKRSAAAADR